MSQPIDKNYKLYCPVCEIEQPVEVFLERVCFYFKPGRAGLEYLSDSGNAIIRCTECYTDIMSTHPDEDYDREAERLFQAALDEVPFKYD